MTTWQTILSWSFFIINFQALFRKAEVRPEWLQFIHSILGQWKNNCTNFSIKYPDRLLLIILTFLFDRTSSKTSDFSDNVQKRHFAPIHLAPNKDCTQASGWSWLHHYTSRGTQSGFIQMLLSLASALPHLSRAAQKHSVLHVMPAITKICINIDSNSEETWTSQHCRQVWMLPLPDSPSPSHCQSPHPMGNTWFPPFPPSCWGLAPCHPSCRSPSLRD